MTAVNTMPATTLFTNAEIVTADDRFRGWVAVHGGVIVEMGDGRAPDSGGIDWGGDLLLPGLVEIHTDNLETHYLPRPKVIWHPASAVLSYDAQIATAGITTVFDSLRIGLDDFDNRTDALTRAGLLADAVAKAQELGHLRADHRIHLRCEVPTTDVVGALETMLASHPVALISLMDHTPGQRQFRDTDKWFVYYGGRTGRSDAEVAEILAHRQRVGRERSEVNRPALVALARLHGIAIASHDDTTLAEVAQSVAEGVSIAEFPTTMEAAQASRAAGMATVMGGPNVVRGGSHSGNVAASALAEAGLLDILSSDYVPSSLLVAAFQLAETGMIRDLPAAVRLVSKNPADATNLHDRGEIAPAKRADMLRVHLAGGHPIVREVWRGGQRVA